MADRFRRRCAALTLTLVSVAAVAACGSGAHSGASATAVGDSAAVQFADCMRAHGVPDFPDPLPTGGFPREPGGQSPASQMAQKACVHLLKGGSGSRRAPTRAELTAAVTYARCMRAHGVPDFPDPVTSQLPPNTNVIVQGPIRFPLGSSINVDAPAFQQADAACGAPHGGHPQGG